MNDEEFHAFRKKGIGGSEVAAILGASPYQKPIDVYNDKVFDYRPPFYHTLQKAMEQGKKFEADILKWGGFDSMRSQPSQIIHPDNEIFFGNVDGWNSVPDSATLHLYEAKTETYKNMHLYGEGNNYENIPQHYRYQIEHYAYILYKLSISAMRVKLVWIHFCVWFIDRQTEQIIDRRHYRMSFGEINHLERVRSVNKKLMEFWEEYIVPKKMPSNHWFAPHTIIKKEDMEMIEKLQTTKARMKELLTQKKLIKAYLTQQYKEGVITDKNGNILAVGKIIKKKAYTVTDSEYFTWRVPKKDVFEF